MMIPVQVAAIDTWASAATALGTLVLAAATFNMVRKTGDLAQSSKDEATATLDLAKLGRQQMRQQHLPVVMPVIEQLSIVEAGQPRIVTIAIPVVNIGLGPALGIRLRIEWLDQDGNPSVAPQPLEIPAKLAGLGAGQRWDIHARYRGLATPPLPFRVELQFGDTFGSGYRVWGRYFPDQGSFSELEFDTLDAQGVTVTTITT